MKSEDAAVRALLVRWACLYAMQCVLLLALALSVLHMMNVYPKYYGPALAEREEALLFVQMCENPAVRYSKHASCADAAAHASANVRMVALEKTLHEFLGHFNMLEPLTRDSRLSYVLLRSADNIMSSSLLLLLVVVLALLWLLYSFTSGPMRYYNQYSMLQAQHDVCVPSVALTLRDDQGYLRERR